MVSMKKMAAGLVVMAAFVAACSSTATSSQNVAGVSSAPSVAASPSSAGLPYGGGASASTAPSAAASSAASSAASAPAAGGATVEVKSVGGSNILVAGSNGMTVYTFTKDTPNSGQSACTGGCLTTWPALTVPSGQTPTAGSGVSGKLGTITRGDNGQLQVTYNGLPLYFYAGDSAPGDTNGHYPQWNLVQP